MPAALAGILGAAVWLVWGLGSMSTLDASTDFRLSHEVRARLRVSDYTAIVLLIVFWPLGLAWAVWMLFRK